jgi:hypothetical protein
VGYGFESLFNSQTALRNMPEHYMTITRKALNRPLPRSAKTSRAVASPSAADPAKPVRTKVRTRTKLAELKAAVAVAKCAQTGHEKTLGKAHVIAELSKSPHGNLADYVAVGLRAATEDPDFFAHLLAWDAVVGQIRDAKIALPVLALAARPSDKDYAENAMAHLADLPPFMFIRAWDFAKAVQAPIKPFRRLAKRYLRDLEADFFRWERTAVSHRQQLIELYARFRVKPADFAKEALFEKRPVAGRLRAVRELASMTPLEAAGAIGKYNLPFKVVRGVMKDKLKNPDVIVAMINQMSSNDVVSSAKLLQNLGAMNIPACRAAYEQALKRVSESKRPNSTLKTSRAADALAAAGDTKLADKLHNVQEQQLDHLKGIDGDWLVLADKSGSMHTAIDVARQITAILARLVKGKVHLAFFDSDVRYFDATGQTLEALTRLTKGIMANGGTSIGAGINYATDRKLAVTGIVIISDGACHAYSANRFPPAYKRYTEAMGIQPSVYFYQLAGEPNNLTSECRVAGIDLKEFDLTRGKVDAYSLPNLVQTMRASKYSLLDDVFDTPLKTLDSVLSRTVGQGVLAHGTANKVAI